MSEAIQGHGFRDLGRVVAACKCGWRGSSWPTHEIDKARAEFEGHKHEVRKTLPPRPVSRSRRREPAPPVERHLRVVS